MIKICEHAEVESVGCDQCGKQVKVYSLDPDEVRWMLECLLSVAPEWATKMEKGLDPIYYGTGSYEGDLGVYAKIQRIKKLVEELEGGKNG